MTGLDKIVKQIQDDAQAAAQELTAKAKAEAEEMLKKAREEAQAQAAAMRTQSEHEVQNQMTAAQSAAALAKRRAVLVAKQEIISEVIAEAEQELYALPDHEYFDLILKMVKKYSLPQDGKILFSQKDLVRLPAGFPDKVREAASGRLTLMDQTRAIEGGFVLEYDGIEENCSIRALFDAAREQLQDEVHQILFS